MVNIDAINETILLSVFLMGFILGSALTVFIHHLKERK